MAKKTTRRRTATTSAPPQRLPPVPTVHFSPPQPPQPPAVPPSATPPVPPTSVTTHSFRALISRNTGNLGRWALLALAVALCWLLWPTDCRVHALLDFQKGENDKSPPIATVTPASQPAVVTNSGSIPTSQPTTTTTTATVVEREEVSVPPTIPPATPPATPTTIHRVLVEGVVQHEVHHHFPASMPAVEMRAPAAFPAINGRVDTSGELLTVSPSYPRYPIKSDTWVTPLEGGDPRLIYRGEEVAVVEEREDYFYIKYEVASRSPADRRRCELESGKSAKLARRDFERITR